MSKITYISNIELKKLLNDANQEERLELSKLLYEEDDDEPVTYAADYKFLHEEIISSSSYLDLLIDIANKLDISVQSYKGEVIKYDKVDKLEYDYKKATTLGLNYAHVLEEKITIKIFGYIYENMEESKKELFDKTLQTVAEKNGNASHKNLVGAAGLLVLGNMGGFATYTFLTTMMSTLSFGALGFGAYTAATSMLSVLLGPVGWAGLGLFAIHKLNQPDFKKLIPVVVTIGMIRNRVNDESNQKN